MKSHSSQIKSITEGETDFLKNSTHNWSKLIPISTLCLKDKVGKKSLV